MRTAYYLATVVAIAAAPSMAANPISRDQLEMLISGNTLYVTVPAGAPGAPVGGVAPIYFGADGSTSAKLPAGLTLVGTWVLADGG